MVSAGFHRTLKQCFYRDVCLRNDKNMYLYIYIYIQVFLCGSVVEHCVSSAKGCGFDSQGTRTNENV